MAEITINCLDEGVPRSPHAQLTGDQHGHLSVSLEIGDCAIEICNARPDDFACLGDKLLAIAAFLRCEPKQEEAK